MTHLKAVFLQERDGVVFICTVCGVMYDPEYAVGLPHRHPDCVVCKLRESIA